ncbi:uncharacterized protein YdeI (YjbR/CyaY-like superfamily) [Pedobacter psychrotolerans]|uniref:Uncharacterized protein YdeI (YjbR/CyaY-like superfamily) n=1 Tax=Pedobacter psychrotolerans TaxID=1843235 RepID=A0A4R2HLQ5_9SPHI|nr:YdeI/OmpD-associated family protein [Pedobacter psychrotolerans]TCO31117.1 uncharacterized protein YdeI (YjbR/CyaY-like superfamily) [Pedobacter psychrotolerans]GGE42108.1 hypothetical protein GCM10011413_04980 [Pedobacter psychrotolerans]
MEQETFYPENKSQWRAWLKENHALKKSIWVIFYKKKTGRPTINWSEAVDEALCFGWIDSIGKPIDDEKFMQYFCQRKPNSTWSKINKDKVNVLLEANLITDAGKYCIDIAKQNGSWTILDEVEALIIPKDLELAFAEQPEAAIFFSNLSRTVKKGILQWLVLAKRPATRASRIKDVIQFCLEKNIPKQFRP